MAFDKTKPIPGDHHIGDWANKYRFGDMSVGDSIFASGWNDGMRLRRAAAAYRGHHPEWRYKSRRETDVASGLDGMRIWRTA